MWDNPMAGRHRGEKRDGEGLSVELIARLSVEQAEGRNLLTMRI